MRCCYLGLRLHGAIEISGRRRCCVGLGSCANSVKEEWSCRARLGEEFLTSFAPPLDLSLFVDRLRLFKVLLWFWFSERHPIVRLALACNNIYDDMGRLTSGKSWKSHVHWKSLCSV